MLLGECARCLKTYGCISVLVHAVKRNRVADGFFLFQIKKLQNKFEAFQYLEPMEGLEPTTC
ncbi:MAG TPA: hypothetical protein DHU86_04685 [Polaribacter sp.]|nr:hypothetical protein [Polaribacter sp.]